MLLDLSVTNHLRKYYDWALSHYENGDKALATFFAITLIEECAKILYLRDADLKDRKQRQGATDHQEKRLVALVNLLSASDRFDTLPKQWQELAWSWFGSEQLMRLRNDSLYIRFNTEGELATPDQAISLGQAALLVYLAGFVAVELREFVSLGPAWVKYILRRNEAFRSTYLKG